MSAPRTIQVEPDWEAMCEWFARALAEHAFNQFETNPVISFIEQVRYLTDTDPEAVARIIEKVRRPMSACTRSHRDCHTGIEGHWCPTPADRAERHDPATCRACLRSNPNAVLVDEDQGVCPNGHLCRLVAGPDGFLYRECEQDGRFLPLIRWNLDLEDIEEATAADPFLRAWARDFLADQAVTPVGPRVKLATTSGGIRP